MRRSILLAIFAVAGLRTTAAFASVIWQGTFTTGDLSQWTEKQMVNPDRLEVVADPLQPTRKVLKVNVHPGDNPINASGNRNELAYMGDNPVGQERFYRWSTMWPQDYSSPQTWQLFTQWHHTGNNGSPPVEFFAWGEQLRLNIASKEVWNAPLERGAWHDFVLHVKWSSDPTQGFVELYYDGKLVLPKMYAATLFPGQGVYLKQGLYRNADVSVDQTIYQSGATIGTTLDDVWPQGAPPAPTPPPPHGPLPVHAAIQFQP